MTSEDDNNRTVDHHHHHQEQPPPPQPSEDDKNRADVDHHHHHHQEQPPPPPPPASEDDKNRDAVVDHHHHRHQEQPPPPPPPQPQYGKFQGVANYPPPPPAIGFPQPIPPPGASDHHHHFSYCPPCYQTVPGYAVAEGKPLRERRLPCCCGIGVGWCLFIFGFFLGAIPWYLGLFVLMCARIDYREKPGYIACTIAAILATVAIVLGATKGANEW